MLPSHAANEKEGGLSGISLQGSPSCEAPASTKYLFSWTLDGCLRPPEIAYSSTW